MENRAVVCFANRHELEPFYKDDELHLDGFTQNVKDSKVGVYLHWNGGMDSVKAFCETCKRLGFRSGANDNYGIARFAQVACNFFGNDGLSCGVDLMSRLYTRNGDNGVYVVDGEWNIIGREFYDCAEQNAHDSSDFADKLVKMQLDVKFPG